MKKSKIVIPALSMIAFSTAASIAGSVAWFTASRQATISAGTYTVVKTTTNLKYALEAGAGTQISGNIVTLGDNKLTDGSFNHLTGKIYTPDDSGTGLAASPKGEIALPTYNKTTYATDITTLEGLLKRADLTEGAVYTAVTFRISFTISFGATEGDYGLFLNTTASQYQTAANQDEDAETVDTTAKGFRMAFYPDAAPEGGSAVKKSTVFADLQKEKVANPEYDAGDPSKGPEYFTNCKYIASTTDENIAGTAYDISTNHDLVDADYNEALPTSSTPRATAQTRNDYLGFFKFKESSEVTLSYTVVAWFEGTDPEIVNRTKAEEYQSVTSRLVFDAVKLNA